MLEQPLLSTGSSSIQFFYSPPFRNTVSQATFGTLTLTMQHLCELRDAWRSTGHQVLPTQPQVGKKRISLRMANIRRMLLCPHTQITCNQKVGRFYLCIKVFYGTQMNLLLVQNLFFNRLICRKLLVLTTRTQTLSVYILINKT